MANLIIPEGVPNIVNLTESKSCCFCGNLTRKRKKMWKYPDMNYMCTYCKTRFDEATVKGTTYSTDNATVV